MKQKFFFGLLITLLVAAYSSFTASGQTDVSVSNADATLRPPLSNSVQLNNALAPIPKRIASEFSDGLHLYTLTPDSALKAALDQVVRHVSFDFAQGSRVATLQFPKELVNDTTAPQLQGEVGVLSGSDSATLTLTTNEFTVATILYGTQSGSYPNQKSDTSFAKQHQVSLTGLAKGQKVFYRVVLTDLSGNVNTLAEQSFTINTVRTVYLPFVSR